MKDKDILRMQQLEDILAPFHQVSNVQPPQGGWVRAIRESLGMTNVQLAKRLGRKAPQTIEDMLQYEAAGTIKLKTLRELAEALECQLVYAIVPTKPFEEIRRNRAIAIAKKMLRSASHSMKLEEQGVTSREEQRALERLVQKLLADNPKKLWE